MFSLKVLHFPVASTSGIHYYKSGIQTDKELSMTFSAFTDTQISL